MIRAVLIFAGFLSVTIALILIQPTAGLRGQDAAEMDTTRADTLLSDDAVIAVGTAYTEEEEALGFGLLDSAPTPEPEPTGQTERSGLLAALDLAGEPSVPTAPQPPAGGLESMIVKALQQGQSEAYIDALVNNAAARGNVDVPGELVTEDGRVDTSTLLSVLSGQTDNGENGLDSGFYVVKPGDSLASIAYRFYGKTRYHEEIYRANRAQLGEGGSLQVGQRLIMPRL